MNAHQGSHDGTNSNANILPVPTCVSSAIICFTCLGYSENHQFCLNLLTLGCKMNNISPGYSWK